MKQSKSIRLFTANEFKKYIKSKKVHTSVFKTPAGSLAIEYTEDGIFKAAFEEHSSYIKDSKISLDSLLLVGTQFQCKVWQALLDLEKGTTCTYQELACIIGKAKSHRAVANALGANKLAYIVPCHRIVRKNGDLGGYAWGIDRKQALLSSECA